MSSVPVPRRCTVRVAGHDGAYVGEGETTGQAVAAAYAQHEAQANGLTTLGLLLIAGDTLRQQHDALNPEGCPGCGVCSILLPLIQRTLVRGGVR
jgi:hypothetical protein